MHWLSLKRLSQSNGYYQAHLSPCLIIIMLAYLYCAAYTRMTMYESSLPCEQRRIAFNDDGQRVQLVRPEIPAPHCICMYRLLPTTPPPHPPSPSRHYYPRLIAGTNLSTPKGWIAWLTKADCTHITFAQRLCAFARRSNSWIRLKVSV